VESCLYRIAREALANVRKHAHAKNVRVVCECDDAEVRLEIADDGDGLPLSDPTRLLDHFGILMMQEQAAACGGRCVVGPGRKGGVVVSARIGLGRIDNEADTVGGRRWQ
jgi:signal transduction histidine kinase